jgi:rubrerythrin
MTDPIAENARELLTKRALEAFSKKVKGNRAYALSLADLNQLGAFAQADRDTALEEGRRFDIIDDLAKHFDQLAQDLPGLKQNRPAPEDVAPKIPVDANGIAARNPWEKDHENLSDQMFLEKRDPALAAHLKSQANGLSYAELFAQQDERVRREKLRTLEYGEKEHRANPFLLTGKEGLRAQSEFVKTHGSEPWLVDYYKAEAETPVTLNFGNLTVRSKVAKRDAKLGEIYQRAEKIHAQWLKQDLERLKAQQEADRTHIEATQQALATASAR